MRAWIAVLLMLCGCAGPVVDPFSKREPRALTVARATQPRIIWLLDKSGSMNETTPAGGTRFQAVSSWISSLSLPQVSHTVIQYPALGGNGCNPPSFSSSAADVNGVAEQFTSSISSGGTPTSAALSYASGLGLTSPTSDTFAVLATDGLPNCNPANTATCGSAGTCSCTLGPAGCNSAGACPIACLDDVATLNASRVLASMGIQLMVVGFGESLETDARGLTSMDIALPRRCQTNADCGGGGTAGTCDASKTCTERIYTMNTAPDQAAARKRITDAIEDSVSCHFILPEDSLETSLTVAVEGSLVSAGDNGWSVDHFRHLRFNGSTCAALKASGGTPTVLTTAQ